MLSLHINRGVWAALRAAEATGEPAKPYCVVPYYVLGFEKKRGELGFLEGIEYVLLKRALSSMFGVAVSNNRSSI